MKLRSIAYVALAGGIVLLAGCGSYYMVRDPGSGTTYYTRDIDRPGGAGTVRFQDGRTEKQVTLQNSEVTPVSRDEYRKNINTR
jgi:hypothetical protein